MQGSSGRCMLSAHAGYAWSPELLKESLSPSYVYMALRCRGYILRDSRAEHIENNLRLQNTGQVPLKSQLEHVHSFTHRYRRSRQRLRYVVRHAWSVWRTPLYLIKLITRFVCRHWWRDSVCTFLQFSLALCGRLFSSPPRSLCRGSALNMARLHVARPPASVEPVCRVLGC